MNFLIQYTNLGFCSAVFSAFAKKNPQFIAKVKNDVRISALPS